MVEAAVSKTLPLSVLLGRHVPELLDLINTPREVDDSLVAMTRARSSKQAQLEQADQLSGATPHAGLDSPAANNPTLDSTLSESNGEALHQPTAAR